MILFYFFFNSRKSNLIFSGVGQWLLGGGWQGGKGPKETFQADGCVHCLVHGGGSQVFACVTNHPVTHFKFIVHQLYLMKPLLKIA